MKHDTSSGSGRQLQEGTAIAGLKSAVKQRSETSEEGIRDNTARLDESTDHRDLANDQRPELSLPFIGYTLTEASRPKSREQMSSDGDLLLHPCSEQDILQNFDFDSFLLQDEEASEFRLPPVTGPSDIPASDTPQTPVYSSFSFPAAEADPPTYINAKQFYRILKRRYARQVLEEESAARDTLLLLSKRRHEEEGETPESKESTTRSSDSKSNPIPMQVRAQGNKTKLQLGDPKRLRNPGASARFRARRREKERKAAEEAIAGKKNGSKGSNESPPGPSSPDLSFTFSSAEVDKPPAEPLSPLINPSTCLSPTVSSCSPSTKPSFRPDACLSLSTLQQSKLWWRSYASIRLYNSPAFEVLCFGIFNELGILTSSTSHDETICRQISAEFKRFDEINFSYRQKEEGLVDILEMRSNVLRIVKTIDEQLGLQLATLGWSCVCVFLRVYERILTKDSISQETIEVTNQAFAQLQDLVAIIARYSVMENLYQQSGSVLSLKDEYQSALLSLCSTILEYFALSFKLGRAMAGSDSMTDEIQGLINACGQLIETVRDKDMACQSFRVVVEAKMDSGSESEGEVEDMSDDSWEEIGIPSSEPGIIDFGAAIV